MPFILPTSNSLSLLKGLTAQSHKLPHQPNEPQNMDIPASHPLNLPPQSLHTQTLSTSHSNDPSYVCNSI